MKLHLHLVSLIAWAMLLAAPAAYAQYIDYYVAKTGNDANPGTQAQPFLTISRAVSAGSPGDAIVIAAGTYTENVSFSTVLDFKGAGAAQTIINGAMTYSPTEHFMWSISACTVKGQISSVGSLGMIDCIIDGGGLYSRSSSLYLVNCVFKNSPRPGIDTQGYDLNASNCTFSNNAGAGIHNQGGNPNITRCTFNNNGRGMFNGEGQVTVSHCSFVSNTGVGMENQLNDAALDNCTFLNNTGGGIINYQSNTRMTHCTISGNSGGQLGCGGIFNYGTLQLSMCILYGNAGTEIGQNPATVSYSNVEGGHLGTGNINADPKLVNLAAGNCRLQATSPCINAGEASASGVDLDGAPRFMASAPDMGAYEFWTAAYGPCVDRAVGKDTNTGTPLLPFATIAKAIAVAASGNSIYIKPGDYGTDKPRITKALRLRNWNNAGLVRIGQP